MVATSLVAKLGCRFVLSNCNPLLVMASLTSSQAGRSQSSPPNGTLGMMGLLLLDMKRILRLNVLVMNDIGMTREWYDSGDFLE